MTVALLGHSLYHALDYHHDHHHDGGHHSHHHDGDSSKSQPGPDARNEIKCELFSLLPVAPQASLVLERLGVVAIFPQGALWNGFVAYLTPNSRAPPISS